MASAAWTPVDENAAKWTPVEENTKPAEKPGFFKRLGQSLGLPTSQQELQSATPQNAEDVTHTLLDPIGTVVKNAIQGYGQTAYQGLKQGGQEAIEAGQQYKSGQVPLGQATGKMLHGAAHTSLQALPFIGPSIETAGEDIQQGNKAGAAGGLTGVIGQVVAPELAKRLPAATAGAREAIASRLTESSAKNLGDVLSPTTKANKFITKNKLVPGMQERGIVASTAKGLQEKAATMKESAGNAIDEAFDAMPQQPSISTAPILDDLENYKAKFINEVPQPGGGVKQIVLDRGAIDRINEMQDLVKEHGDTIDPQSLRQLRQYLDESVSKAKGYQGQTLAEGQKVDVQRVAANSIRGELAKAVPGLGDLNSEFSFWKNLEDVMGATNQRRVGQVGGGLGRKIATGVGASVGGSVGGVKGAVIGAEAGNFLSKAINSTAWNTVSSKLKMGLANAISSQDPVQVNAALHDIQQAMPPSALKEPSNIQAIAEPQSTAHGTGGASVEELARGEKFWRIKKNGQLSYQGVSPDANLQDGEALVAVKKDGSMRVQDSRMNLGEQGVLTKFGGKIKMAAKQ